MSSFKFDGFVWDVRNYFSNETIDPWGDTMTYRRLRLPGLVVRSFAEGDRELYVEPRVDEDSVLADALWLQNHGLVDQAEMLIDSYCSR